MTVINTDWSSHHEELIKSYIHACSDHLIGDILIPGPYGLKDPHKLYLEHWHYPEFQEGAPVAFLKMLRNIKYPADRYGFHEQLWCGVLAPPDKPYEVTFLCTQLQHQSLRDVVEAMIPSRAKLYSSAFDLYELFEELGLTDRHRRQSEHGEWLSYAEVNADLSALERVFQNLLYSEFSDMLIDYLQHLKA